MNNTTKDSALELSIVIPVYRSEMILPKLVNAIAELQNNPEFQNKIELILVNDCSPDQSWSKIKELSKAFDFIKGINLRKNFGQHNATMAGLNNASGRFVVIMDDDLQHPPEAITEMIETLKSGFDVCYTHYLNRQHEKWKKFGSKFNDKAATLLLGKPSELYLSSFKALRREIAEEIIKYDGPYAYYKVHYQHQHTTSRETRRKRKL